MLLWSYSVSIASISIYYWYFVCACCLFVYLRLYGSFHKWSLHRFNLCPNRWGVFLSIFLVFTVASLPFRTSSTHHFDGAGMRSQWCERQTIHSPCTLALVCDICKFMQFLSIRYCFEQIWSCSCYLHHRLYIFPSYRYTSLYLLHIVTM